jgi:hypothetical protein
MTSREWLLADSHRGIRNLTYVEQRVRRVPKIFRCLLKRTAFPREPEYPRGYILLLTPSKDSRNVLLRSEQPLGQIFNLGVESHDDLCDGLASLLQGLVEQGLELPKIHWI